MTSSLLTTGRAKSGTVEDIDMAMYGKGKKAAPKSKAKKAFKPCKGCPTPKMCTAMGRCKAKS